MKKEDIIEILKNVYDPDYRDRSIVDMGLVNEDDIRIAENKIEISYRLTAPLCPFSAAIGVMIRYVLESKTDKRIIVKLKAGHYQEKLVNEILNDEAKSNDLLQKLKEFGVFEQCVRI